MLAEYILLRQIKALLGSMRPLCISFFLSSTTCALDPRSLQPFNDYPYELLF